MAILTPAQEARVKVHVSERNKERQALDRDYMNLFACPVGEKVLDDLRRQAFLTRTIVAMDATGRVDGKQTFLNEGSRMTILYIEQRIGRAIKGE